MAAKYELLKNLTSATAETRTFLVRVVNPEVVDYVCWLRRGGLRVIFLVAPCVGFVVLSASYMFTWNVLPLNGTECRIK